MAPSVDGLSAKISFWPNEKHERWGVNHMRVTYTLPPGIITRHEVHPSALPLWVCIDKRMIVKLILEVWIVEHVCDDTVDIAEPNLIFCHLPGGWILFFRALFLRHRKTLPWCTSQPYLVDCCIHMVCWHKRALIWVVPSIRFMFECSGSQKLHEQIDGACRHLHPSEKKVRKQKIGLVGERWPVILCMWCLRWWWWIGW